MPFSEPDRHRHAIDAEATLATMDFLEDLAQLAAEADTGRERERFATRYRQLLGFDPAHREEVRESLRHIQEGGHRSPQDLINDFARQSENLYPPPSGSAASGV